MKYRFEKLYLLLAVSVLFASCEDRFLHVVDAVNYPKHEDTHTIYENLDDGTVDILWVIDNSGSMGSYQNQVIANTGEFIGPFAENNNASKWRMGLISTAQAEQPYLGLGTQLFDYMTLDPISVFQAAVRSLGTFGDSSEKTFDPIIKHLNTNRTFLRSRAHLALIVVTDAPEQSVNYPSATVFISQLQLLKSDLKRVHGYGIFAARDMGCNSSAESEWDYEQSAYKEAFEQFGDHQIFNLCKDNFGVALSKIGRDLAKIRSQNKIFLDHRPILSTLSVSYLGRDLPFGPKSDGGIWMYDANMNAVVFHDLSFISGGDLEQVTIHYTQDVTTP